MAFNDLFGLPAHPLIVHAAVVLLPLAAVGTVAAAAVPRWRRLYAPLALALSLAATVAIYLAKESGESLERRVAESALIERHAELADQVLPWAIGVVVVAAAITAVDRVRSDRWRISARATTLGLIAVALIAGTGATWTVVVTGHSGAEATWHDVSDSGGG
jgi:hypothetical protein